MEMELLKDLFEQDEQMKEALNAEDTMKTLDLEQWERDAYQSGMFADRVDIIEQNCQILAKRLLKKKLKTQFETWKLFVYLFREAIRNAPEHGKANVVQFQALLEEEADQSYLNLKVTDGGIGIYNSLCMNRVHKSYLENNREALLWALKPGISGSFSPGHNGRENDPNANSGYGLFMISEVVKKLGGSMVLASGTATLYLDRDTCTVKDIPYQGTALLLQFPTDGIDDFQALIDEVRISGEAAAKEIKHAFQEASAPSKGLLQL